MRIAFLSAGAQAGDAIGNQIAEKVAFFQDRGADVRVFVEDDQRLHAALRACCTHVHAEADTGPVLDFLAGADLIFVDYGQAYRLPTLLPLFAGGRGRIIFDYHGVTPAHLWGGHNREAIAQGARQRGLVWCADAALVHSRFAAGELRAATGFPADRLFQVPHAIDTEALAPRPLTGSVRRQLGLQDATILLFVGRLAPNKRVPVLIEALARLRARTPAVHAVVIGDASDAYQVEADHCRQRAAELDVADRLHILGHVEPERLREAYQTADLFVMPSIHEGFCIPVLEAMACGLPVIAARAGALPETVGSAGLTFTPDDADDLARQVERVLEGGKAEGGRGKSADRKLRVVVVTPRIGSDFAGGAEASLALMARTLRAAGHHVEVFTAGPAGTGESDGIPVHRFPLDAGDEQGQAALLQRIELGENIGSEFLDSIPRSTGLLDALRQRNAEFDAILTGPYLSGVALDTARAFPTKTVLVPCFHDEPAARLEALLAIYREVGGLLYHSLDEQQFAEAELGVNHPGTVGAGTVLNLSQRGDPARGQALVGTGRRYLVYSGRAAADKGLPRLLEYARRYAAEHPERFTFALTGDREGTIPEEPWLRNLGFLSADSLRDVLAGAAALVQLSRRESLSLAALEAWAQGTPVLADAGCAVLVGHMQRGGGGRAVADYGAFAAALNDLWLQPERWRDMGRQGREYVAREYGSQDAFLGRLEEILASLPRPLGERMRDQGLRRATEYSRPRWREGFARLVEEWLHAPARPLREEIEIQPRSPERRVSADADSTLFPVRLVNRGTHAAVAEGPARVVIRGRLLDAAGQACAVIPDTPLPDLLLSGRPLPVVVRVPVPSKPGTYQVALSAERAEGTLPTPSNGIRLRLIVDGQPSVQPSAPALAETVQQALAAAESLHRLPEDYLDVSTGWLGPCKRWLKRKLLNNFKRAYVDVVVRQQSAFNRQVLTALQELAECCAALEQNANREAAFSRSPPGSAGNSQGMTPALPGGERLNPLPDEQEVHS